MESWQQTYARFIDEALANSPSPTSNMATPPTNQPPPPKTTHFPLSSLLSTTPPHPFALLILNTPLNAPTVHHLLPHASLLICADAGADRYYAFQLDSLYRYTDPGTPRSSHMGSTRTPDAIVGDLDSLSDNTRQVYASMGVQIVEDKSVDTTDFAKCLGYLRRGWRERSALPGMPTSLDVVVLGGLSGRVDQGMSALHHVYLAERELDERGEVRGEVEERERWQGKTYLLSRQSLTFALCTGRNVLHLGQEGVESGEQRFRMNAEGMSSRAAVFGERASAKTPSDAFGENIGILPLRGPCKITTKGLEWDVTRWHTEFGGQVSTSNHIRSGTVEIDIVEGQNPLCTVELGGQFRMNES
jgi:thiamine pyrophosphokinase